MECTVETLAHQQVPRNNNSAGSGGWQPPYTGPAFEALLRPGRAAFAGGASADGCAGYAAWSSQIALPFQAFSLGSAGRAGLGAGAARISTKLRCGSQLPYTLRLGFFGDVTADGRVDEDDAVVWARGQSPLADSVYRSGVQRVLLVLLVLLLLVLTPRFQVFMKVQNDVTSYAAQEKNARVSFNDTLATVKALSRWADNQTVVLFLVGWQGSGHDTLYPSLDHVNANLGAGTEAQATAELRQLAAAALEYNVIISYHINTDEAYVNLTATKCTAPLELPAQCNYSEHPVPATSDGKPNTDINDRNVAKLPRRVVAPKAEVPRWFAWQCPQLSDPFQGCAYHVSKAKDAASGQRWRRYEQFLSAVPVSGTVHSDAYRDINLSWEHDEAGFIAEDEEAACGLLGDHEWWANHSLSFGVEGGNGALVAVGPTPGFMQVVSYYYHGSPGMGAWRRIVSGTTQGLDHDIVPGSGTPSLKGGGPTQKQKDAIYTRAFVYMLQMTAESLDADGTRFSNGGNSTHWPYAGDWIEYAKNCSLAHGVLHPCPDVFLPEVLPPPAGAAKDAPTTLSPTKVRVYSLQGGDRSWTLPLSWAGKQIRARSLGGGATSAVVAVAGRTLTLKNTPKQSPVILTVSDEREELQVKADDEELKTLTCNQSAASKYVRCASNPLARAGTYHNDSGLYEVSIGDPDVQFDSASNTWLAYWSTGLQPTYSSKSQTMAIKKATSADGVAWSVSLKPVLLASASPTAWDFSKTETPTVVRLPPALRTAERQWLMLYSGANAAASARHGSFSADPWYQIGAAFSADGERFERLQGSPYSSRSRGSYSNLSTEGLVLMGADAFPGMSGVADGLLADPELVVDPDGKTLHLFMSSLATDAKSGALAYGVSHATSADGGAMWTPSAANPAVNGGAGPSVLRSEVGWQLFFLQDSSADKAKVPTTFNPELGVWAANATSLRGPWASQNNGAGAGGREISWCDTCGPEQLGWIATGDFAFNAPGGEKRWYFPAFDPHPPIPAGWVAPVHRSLRHPLGLQPAVMALSMAHRDKTDDDDVTSALAVVRGFDWPNATGSPRWSTCHNWSALTHVTWGTVGLDKHGGVAPVSGGGFDDAKALVAQAKPHTVKVMLTIAADSSKLTNATALLANASACAAAVDNIARLLTTIGASGVVLDIEHVRSSAALKQFYAPFVLRVAAKLRAMELEPPFVFVGWRPRILDLPYKELAAKSKLIIMAYGVHSEGSAHAGPSSLLVAKGDLLNLVGIQTGVKEFLALDGVEPSSLMLGLPWCGYEWPIKDGAAASAPGAAAAGAGRLTRFNALIERMASTKLDPTQKLTLHYDAAIENPWYSWSNKTHVRQGWYDNGRSLSAKWKFLKSQRLAGAEIWGLQFGVGKQSAELWTAFKTDDELLYPGSVTYDLPAVRVNASDGTNDTRSWSQMPLGNGNLSIKVAGAPVAGIVNADAQGGPSIGEWQEGQRTTVQATCKENTIVSLVVTPPSRKRDVVLLGCNDATATALKTDDIITERWLRPTTVLSLPSAPTSGDGKTYNTAWRSVDQVRWAELSGGTLWICGVGLGNLALPPGLSNVIIDGACAADKTRSKALFLGGSSLNFSQFVVAGGGLYRAAVGSNVREVSVPFATEVFRSTAAGALPAARLQRRNCSDQSSWSAGSYTICSLARRGGSILYKPSRPPSEVAALQLQAATVVSLYNTTRVTVRNLQVLGPAERLIDIAGGARPKIAGCELRWGSYTTIALNFKSAHGMGVANLRLINNSITESGTGVYFVNQKASRDATANSNGSLVHNNSITMLDQQGFYKSRDNHAIGVQGGVGNIFTRNHIDGVAGSCITFYQGPSQELSGTRVRYNTCFNVYATAAEAFIEGKPYTHNSRGIEYDSANALVSAGQALPLSGNNSVAFNVLANITGAALRSKATALAAHAAPTWSWAQNTVHDAGVFFETQYVSGETAKAVHADAVQNNVFSCYSCKANYSFHSGWLAAQPSIDSFCNNLYFGNQQARFCRTEMESCTSVSGWRRQSHSRCANQSQFADPQFVDRNAWPQGLRPRSPHAAGSGAAALAPLLDFNGLAMDTSNPDLGAFKMIKTDRVK